MTVMCNYSMPIWHKLDVHCSDNYQKTFHLKPSKSVQKFKLSNLEKKKFPIISELDTSEFPINCLASFSRLVLINGRNVSHLWFVKSHNIVWMTRALVAVRSGSQDPELLDDELLGKVGPKPGYFIPTWKLLSSRNITITNSIKNFQNPDKLGYHIQ